MFAKFADPNITANVIDRVFQAVVPCRVAALRKAAVSCAAVRFLPVGHDRVQLRGLADEPAVSLPAGVELGIEPGVLLCLFRVDLGLGRRRWRRLPYLIQAVCRRL